MERRLGAVIVGAVLGAACVVLAVFLHREGVVLAGAWAGIIGLLGIPIGALGVWLAWPRGRGEAAGRDEGPNAEIQNNTASQGGTIYAVQEGNQSINYNRSDDDNNGLIPKQHPKREK
jgi:hypothetical protein